uniref:Uncharacterized protein n=1 Tax=Lotharella globosa TaxID=91324 RepID=A0A7S3YVS2_9EUKA
MPRKKDSEETKQRRPGGGLGGFDEYEDSDPVYNLDTTIGKPTISTSIAKSPLSYHRTAKRYYKDRFDEKDPHLWKRDHTVCKRTEVDPYHTTNWSKSTMLSKDKTKAIDWRKSIKKIHQFHVKLMPQRGEMQPISYFSSDPNVHGKLLTIS